MESQDRDAANGAEQVARFARLPLPAERAPLVGGTLEAIYGLIDALDAVELGETPPATAFDPRWDA